MRGSFCGLYTSVKWLADFLSLYGGVSFGACAELRVVHAHPLFARHCRVPVLVSYRDWKIRSLVHKNKVG
jgi:hypothetical protein